MNRSGHVAKIATSTRPPTHFICFSKGYPFDSGMTTSKKGQKELFPFTPKFVIKFKDSAVFAFPFEVQHVFAFRMGTFPAGFVTLVISRTDGIDILRASQEFPAGLFSFPEIRHFLTQSACCHIGGYSQGLPAGSQMMVQIKSPFLFPKGI